MEAQSSNSLFTAWFHRMLRRVRNAQASVSPTRSARSRNCHDDYQSDAALYRDAGAPEGAIYTLPIRLMPTRFE